MPYKKLRPPCEMGMPEKYTEWRPAQEHSLCNLLNSNNRFNVVGAPTGFGKSLVYATQANKNAEKGERTIITVGTKGMQAQLMDDFESIGITSISGKANYNCPMQDDYTCLEGHAGKCPYRKTRMCNYTDAHLKAQESPIVLANNKMWVSANRFGGKGLGKFDNMIVDEAHELPNELAAAMHLRLGPRDIKEILKVQMPRETWNMKAWQEWASIVKDIAVMEAESVREEISETPFPTPSEVKHFIRVRNLLRKLIVLAECDPANWIVEAKEDGLYEFDPINPAYYAESTFFRGIPKVTLYSATIRHKTVRLSGIFGAYQFDEYPSTFSPDRFRIHHVSTCKVDRGTEDLTPWHRRIDQIIKPRLDRKGITHTVSGDRKKLVLNTSKYSDIMMANFKGDITSEVVAKFKLEEPPRNLVSPSVSTGWDFPGTDCEYQIITKVPFPPMTSKIIQERQKRDYEYGAYIAMQSLVQACGRAFRFEEDRCENFIIDDNFLWFWKRYHHLAPKWFGKLVNSTDVLPRPQEKLLNFNKSKVA